MENYYWISMAICRRCLFVGITLKQFKFIFVILLMVMHCINASAQLSRKEMISVYKLTFLDACTDPYVIDTGFREEVCGLYFDGLDQKSYQEIDSMSYLCSLKINSYVNLINESSDGNAYPTKFCVLKFCLDQYNSKDMDKIAKLYAKRMRKAKFNSSS